MSKLLSTLIAVAFAAASATAAAQATPATPAQPATPAAQDQPKADKPKASKAKMNAVVSFTPAKNCRPMMTASEPYR